MPYSLDRKSTRLNSSHTLISYAVFCLKKKNNVDISAGDDLRTATGVSGLDRACHGTAACAAAGARRHPRYLAALRHDVRFFFLMIGRPRRSTLFPPTTLSR